MVEEYKGPLRIGDWLVEPDLDQMSAHGQVLKLEPRVMRLLLSLAETPGVVVSVDRLLERAWPGVIVTPSSIYQGIAELRRLLGDDAKQPRYIVTVPRKGYRLVMPVAAIEVASGSRQQLPSSESGASHGVDEVGEASIHSHSSPGIHPEVLRSGWRPSPVALTGIIAFVAILALVSIRMVDVRSRDAVSEAPPSPVVVLEPIATDKPSTADGFLMTTLSSSLTNALKRGGLTVVPVTSDVPRSARLRIRAQLREMGGEVALDLQLLGPTGATTSDAKAMRLHRPLIESLELGGDVARLVYARLGITDRWPSRPASSVRSSKARGLYVEGQYLWLRNTGQDLDRALASLRASIEIDPEDAEVWATLSRVYANRSDSMTVDRQEAYTSARVAAEKAIALDPRLAGGHVALAHVLWAVDWDWDRARKEIQIALDLEPNQLETLHIAGDIEKTLGHWDEAIALYTRGIRIDPLHASAYSAAGPLACAGRIPEAEATWRRLISLHPDYGGAHAGLARLLSSSGRHDDAVTELRAEREPEFKRIASPAILLSAGQVKEGRHALSDLLSRPQDDVRLYIAEAYAALGDDDSAFHWLELAVNAREVNLAFLKADPMLIRISGDHRWAALLQRIGLPKEGRCNLKA